MQHSIITRGIKYFRSRALTRPKMDDIFENFRREMEDMFSSLLPYSLADWRIPIGLEGTGDERVLYVIW